jgi:hypothetical protein
MIRILTIFIYKTKKLRLRNQLLEVKNSRNITKKRIKIIVFNKTTIKECRNKIKE